MRLVSPLRWVIRAISDRVTTLIVGEEKAADNILQVDEFRSLIEAAEEGQLAAAERVLIANILEAGDTEIVEIMTPRPQTIYVNAERSLPGIIEQFKAIRHSRVPVYLHHRDHVVGFLHAKQVLRQQFQDPEFAETTLGSLLHPPVMAPLTKKVDEMFDFFQTHNARAAMVLEEFGGVEGFVTMTDVLSFTFGHLSNDVAGRDLYHEADEDDYEVPGTITNFGIDDPRMTAIGGVALRHLDRLPKPGDSMALEDIVITILEMSEHRSSRVPVMRGGDHEEGAEDGAPGQTATPEPAGMKEPTADPDGRE